METLETWQGMLESKDVSNLLMICRTASGAELSGPRVGDTEGRRLLEYLATECPEPERQEP